METEVQEDMNITQVFNKLVNIIRSENEDTRRQIREEIANENNKIIRKIEASLGKIDYLEGKYKQVEKRCIDLDRRIRKNNLLIFGLSVPENSDIALFVINKINQLLGINITVNELNNIYQVTGRNSDFIKVEFISYLKKNLILKNGRKLKGTGIYIVQDLCPEDRQERKTLQAHLKSARDNNFHAKIQGRNLIINNQIYTVKDLEQIDISQKDKVDKELSYVEENTRSNSAPPTPGQHTYFEDSLQVFHLNTPLLSEEGPAVTARNKSDKKKETKSQEILPEEEGRTDLEKRILQETKGVDIEKKSKNKEKKKTLSKTKDKLRTASTSSNSDRNLRQKRY